MEPRVATVPYGGTAPASRCVNELPGDWNWRCGGLVKLGFRNPSFGSAVRCFPAVNTGAVRGEGVTCLRLTGECCMGLPRSVHQSAANMSHPRPAQPRAWCFPSCRLP